MTVGIVTTTKDFMALAPDWDNLLMASCKPLPFLSHEWLSSWWRTFGSGRKLLIITVREGSRLVGIAPLCIARTGLQRTVQFIGHRHSDYSDFIVKQGPHQAEITRKLLDTLRGVKNWDSCYLNELPGTGSLLAVKTYLGPTAQIRPVALCPRVSLKSDPRELEANISKNLRQDVGRKIRKAQRERGLVFQAFQGLGALEQTAVLEEVRQLHIERRAQAGGTSMYSDADEWNFMQSVAEGFSHRKWLYLTTLHLDGQAAAYIFSISFQDTVYFIHTGFKAAFSRLSPGKMLFHLSILDAAAKGYSWFDFGREVEAYKTKWTGIAGQNYLLELFAPRLTSRLRVAAHSQLRPAAGNLPGLGTAARAIRNRLRPPTAAQSPGGLARE